MSTTYVDAAGVDVDLDIDNSDTDLSGWWCIACDPFQCPGTNHGGACTFVAHHATAAHHIVVWPEKDDPRMLDLAAIMLGKGRNPKIVEYEVALGPCITYDQWEAMNRPVHGIRRD